MSGKVFIVVSAILFGVGILIAVSADTLKWTVGGVIFAGVNAVGVVRFTLLDRRYKVSEEQRADPS